MDLREILRERVIICDGAMGTMLYSLGVPLGMPPEVANLYKPQLVEGVHREYIEAGAEIIETNTFGANRLKLTKYGLEEKLREINAEGVRLAKRVGEGKALIAGSIGPLDQLLEPYSSLSLGDAKEIFKEQAECLLNEGVDLVILETFHSLLELKIAVLAIKDMSPSIPIIAQMSFSQGGRTSMGVTPPAFAVAMEGLGVDVVGLNCGLGPQEALEVLKDLADSTNLPLAVQPNAGFPTLHEGRTVFPSSPEYFAKFAEEALSLGASIIGGCCGTTPQHIEAIAKAIKGRQTPTRRRPFPLRVASKSKVVNIGEKVPTIIGERINPTNRPLLEEDIRSGRFALAKQEAINQKQKGADILDINVDIVSSSADSMEKLVLALQQEVDLPLSIDSIDPLKMEKGLMAVEGKPILNSFTLDEDSINGMLPLAKRYGALPIGLTMRGGAVPLRAEERLALAKEIWDIAQKQGIKELLIDPALLSCAVSQEHVRETLKAISLIKEELKLPVVMGLSNVSYGLPFRSLLNASFLTMAIAHGLSVAILNPLDERVGEAILASRALLGYDEFCLGYISAFRGRK